MNTTVAEEQARKKKRNMKVPYIIKLGNGGIAYTWSAFTTIYTIKNLKKHLFSAFLYKIDFRYHFSFSCRFGLIMLRNFTFARGLKYDNIGHEIRTTTLFFFPLFRCLLVHKSRVRRMYDSETIEIENMLTKPSKITMNCPDSCEPVRKRLPVRKLAIHRKVF